MSRRRRPEQRCQASIAFSIAIADTCPVQKRKFEVLKDDSDLQYFVIVNIGKYQRGSNPSYFEVVIHEKGLPRSPHQLYLLQNCTDHGRKGVIFLHRSCITELLFPQERKNMQNLTCFSQIRISLCYTGCQ